MSSWWAKLEETLCLYSDCTFFGFYKECNIYTTRRSTMSQYNTFTTLGTITTVRGSLGLSTLALNFEARLCLQLKPFFHISTSQQSAQFMNQRNATNFHKGFPPIGSLPCSNLNQYSLISSPFFADLIFTSHTLLSTIISGAWGPRRRFQCTRFHQSRAQRQW